jgi:hypothetical protein
MDFRQVLRKANVACFNSDQHTADYLVDVTEVVVRLKRRKVECVGLPPGPAT